VKVLISSVGLRPYQRATHLAYLPKESMHTLDLLGVMHGSAMTRGGLFEGPLLFGSQRHAKVSPDSAPVIWQARGCTVFELIVSAAEPDALAHQVLGSHARMEHKFPVEGKIPAIRVCACRVNHQFPLTLDNLFFDWLQRPITPRQVRRVGG